MIIEDNRTGKEKDVRLPKAFKKKWIAALRSGKYSQSVGYLEDSDGYCCLGVACRIQHPKMKLYGDFINDFNFKRLRDVNVPKILKGNIDLPKILSEMNDNGHSFEEIADWIEENL